MGNSLLDHYRKSGRKPSRTTHSKTPTTQRPSSRQDAASVSRREDAQTYSQRDVRKSGSRWTKEDLASYHPNDATMAMAEKLDFTLSDLLANMQGRLSDRQYELIKYDSQTILMLLPIALIVLVALQGLLLWALANGTYPNIVYEIFGLHATTDKLHYLLIILGFSPGFGAGMAIIYMYRAVRNLDRIKSATVEIYTGYVQRSYRGTRFLFYTQANEFYISIDKKKFTVSKSLFQRFDDDMVYRIHYLPHYKKMLSVIVPNRPFR